MTTRDVDSSILGWRLPRHRMGPADVATVMALLRAFRGMPLTREDVSAELQWGEARAKQALRRAVAAGLATVEPDPNAERGRGGPAFLYRAAPEELHDAF